MENADGLGEFGRWLHERQAEGIELWAAIEKPQGGLWIFFWIMGWWSIRLIPRRWIGSGIGFA